MTQLITRHIFSEVMQRPYRHPGNYLSIRLCLGSPSLREGAQALTKQSNPVFLWIATPLRGSQ